MSGVLTAANARKHDAQLKGESISRSQGLAVPANRCWFVGKVSSWWYSDTMSASSSFMATNCPDNIVEARFAVMGGSAKERTTANPDIGAAVVRLLQGGFDAAVTRPGSVMKEWLVVMTFPAADVPLPMTSTPDRADAGGSIPRDTVTNKKEADQQSPVDRTSQLVIVGLPLY